MDPIRVRYAYLRADGLFDVNDADQVIAQSSGSREDYFTLMDIAAHARYGMIGDARYLVPRELRDNEAAIYAWAVAHDRNAPGVLRLVQWLDSHPAPPAFSLSFGF